MSISRNRRRNNADILPSANRSSRFFHLAHVSRICVVSACRYVYNRFAVSINAGTGNISIATYLHTGTANYYLTSTCAGCYAGESCIIGQLDFQISLRISYRFHISGRCRSIAGIPANDIQRRTQIFM